VNSSDTQDGSFADRFSAVLADRGVSLKELRTRLLNAGETVSMATLSYWRSGGRRPEGPRSAGIVASIERELDLPSGELTELLTARPRLGSISLPRLKFGLDRLNDAAAETVEALGTTAIEDQRVIWTQLIVHVHDREQARFSFREMHQGLTDTTRFFPFIHIVPGGHDRLPQFIEATGARLVRTSAHPDGEAFGYLLEYDQPLTRGEVSMVEYAIDAPLVRTFAAIGSTNRVREALIQVRFDTDAIPDWIDAFVGDPFAAEGLPLRFSNNSTVLFSRADFGPGVIGIRWDYDD
jgi:hypothetical protein